jgi:hypothetical protein
VSLPTLTMDINSLHNCCRHEDASVRNKFLSKIDFCWYSSSCVNQLTNFTPFNSTPRPIASTKMAVAPIRPKKTLIANPSTAKEVHAVMSLTHQADSLAKDLDILVRRLKNRRRQVKDQTYRDLMEINGE